MPAPYSAGSIFVSVIPSFKNNQRDIGREYRRQGEEASRQFSDGFDKQVARDLPKAMERSARAGRQAQADAGKQAGTEYSSQFRKTLAEGLKAAERDLDRLRGSDGEIKVPVDVDKDRFRNTFNALVRDIALTRADVTVGADVGQAIYDVDRLMERMRALRDQSSDVDVRSNLSGALASSSQAARSARTQAGLDPEPQQTVAPNQGAFNRNLQQRVASSVNALPPIPLDVDPTPAQRKIIEFRTDAFNLLGDLETDIYLDEGDTLARARALMTLLEGVIETADPEAEVGTSFNAAGALAQLRAFEQAVDPVEVPIVPEMGFFRSRVAEQLKKAGTALPEIPVDADTSEARRRLSEIRTELMTLGENVKVDMDLDEARRKSRELQLELGALRRQNVEIDVDVDAARAIIELTAIERAAKDADRSLADASRSGDDGANAFRAFSGRVLGFAAIGPLAIPVIGGIAGAVGALLPLLATGGIGLGVFALGVMGVGDAVKALQDVQDNAAKDAKTYADGVRNAGRSLNSAEQALADARRSAADGAIQGRERIADAIEREEDAVKNVTRANRDYDDAVADATRAQESLTQAKSDYADRLLDLQYQIRGGALAERRAYMQLAEAEVAYANALADPGATRTEREQLLLDLDEQKYRLDGVLASNRELAEQQADTTRKGVEGSDEVVDAQAKVEQANRRVADAQERVADAEEARADAARDIERARADAARAAEDSARQIRDAQLRLTDAQIDYADAVAATGSSQDKLAESMAKLSPAGREFAEYLFSLRPYLQELRATAQQGLLPGLTEYLDGIITAKGPQFVSIVGGMSQALGDMFRGFGESLQGEAFSAFFDMIESRGPVFLGQIGQALTNLGEGTASLITAFAPSAEDFGNSIVAATERFANWAAGLSNTEGFQNFLAWWQENGPRVTDFIWALGAALINIGVSLAPYALDLMDFVTATLDWIAAADPQTLQNIAVAILGVAVAFQVLVGLNALIRGAGTIWSLGATALTLFNGAALGFSATAGAVAAAFVLIVGALAILGLGFYLLWQNSETFRTIVTAAWNGIVDAVMVAVDWFQTYVWPIMQAVFGQIADIAMWLWQNIIQPAFQGIADVFAVVMDVLRHAWEKVGKPIFDVFVSIIQTLWSVASPLFQLIGIAFSALGSLIAWWWENVVAPVWGAFIDVVVWLWEKVIGPIFRFIADGFGVLAGVLDSVWNGVIKPVFDFFASVLNALVDVFTGTKADIEAIWNSLLDILMSPIVILVDTVLNKGLIAGINWIAQLFTDEDEWIPPIPTDWIPGRATGGPIPGSSPHKRADNIPIMATAGEYMQQVDAVDYYGTGIMDALNRRLIPRELFTDPLYRAYGGPIDRALGQHVLNRFPRARITSAYRPGDSGYHGRAMAVDIGGSIPYPNATGMREMLEINQWLASTMGSGLAQLIHTAPGAVNLLGGRPHTYNAATQADHRNHVHAAIDSIAAITNGVGLTNLGVIGDSSLFGNIADFISSPLDFLKNIVTDFAGDSLNNSLGRLLTEVPMRLAEKGVDALLDLVGLGGESIQTGAIRFDTSDMTGDARDIVKQVAGQFGWGTGPSWNALNWIVNKESGWNPRAQNPTSTASGLFQHINSTWNAYKPPGVLAGRMREADVADQAVAGMRYIQARYGTPGGAKDFWERNRYYGRGGLIEGLINGDITPELHDTGGVIGPGWNVLYNGTRKPEASLNPTQLENIRTIADSGGRRAMIENLNLPLMTQATPEDIADEILHAVTVAGRGGKYDND